MGNDSTTPNQRTATELQGKSAVVTGASKGIGRAVALQLAAGGADVLVHGNSSASEAHEVTRAIRDMHRRADTVLCDLSDHAEQERLIERAWTWHEPVDIWINIAGADVLTGDIARATFEQKLSKLWEVDVAATIRLSRLAGQRMLGHGGVILNMGWDQAQQGMAGDSGQMFAAVKGAVMSFTQSLAQTLAPDVRVNCLAPGWIKTQWGQGAPPEWQARACHESLLERWGTPDDVARVARFLVGPQAAFVNGQIVPINGGFRYGPIASS